jgi:hypothetical protein
MRLWRLLAALVLWIGLGAAPAQAALEVATGVFSIDTGAATTTYSVTGLAFEPKVVLVWWSGRSDTVDASGEQDIQPGFGVCHSLTSRWAVTGQADHDAATTATDEYMTDAACVAVLDTAGAVAGLADFSAFTSDGFTVVVDDAFPTLLRVSYLALGGSDLTNVATGQYTMATSVGEYNAITGLAFQPDFVLVATNFLNTALPSLSAQFWMSIGAATSAANQALLSIFTEDGLATSSTASYARSGEITASHYDLAGDDRESFVQFNSDGVRLNHLEGAAARRVVYLVLKGGQYHVGNFTTATDTSNFTEATPFLPKGALFFSANRAESTQDVSTDHAEWSVGAATSSTARTAQSVRDKEASADADSFSAIEHDQLYINASNDAAQVVEGLGDLVSFDATPQMTLVMDNADPVASFVWYIAFGDAALATCPKTRALLGVGC